VGGKVAVALIIGENKEDIGPRCGGGGCGGKQSLTGQKKQRTGAWKQDDETKGRHKWANDLAVRSGRGIFS